MTQAQSDMAADVTARAEVNTLHFSPPFHCHCSCLAMHVDLFEQTDAALASLM